MTTLISFEGASDDLALVIIDGVPEEYDAYHGAQFHIVSRHGQMQVTLDLDDKSGCWSIGLGPTSEIHPMPDWPVTMSASKDFDYTPRITITAPADAELVAIE
ncbi:Uncharacterised protein [Mycobacteroides abscessus subsp. abscessus]|nr:Uncharacterised protein [Mycobacteroides abscessus subsp. abscessus]